jgi:hypothetical protein
MTTTLATGSARVADDLPQQTAPFSGALSGYQPRRLLQLHWQWWVEQLGPVGDRARARGVLRAAPVSLMLALSTLLVTGVVRIASPVQDAAYGLFAYRGLDVYSGDFLSLPLSGLLSQSWPQWAWTAFVAVVVFAPLEVRVGGRMVLACVLLSQVASTSVVAVLAPALGHRDLLTHPDFGTSCLVVGATAALAWVRRSRLLSIVILASLLVDAFLSAPATAVEHCVAVTVGVLAVMVVKGGRRPRSSKPKGQFSV